MHGRASATSSSTAPSWVRVPDEYRDGTLRVRTLLVVFEGGVKVDFALYPAGHVSEGIRAALPHRVLLDKDQPHRLPGTDVTPPRPEPPGEQAFRRLVEEFWFEAYHVGNYLARNELWLAKSRDWATKQRLMTMVDWHERLVRGRASEGDRTPARTGVSADTWEALNGTFGRFPAEESWDAALETMDLFRRLAGEVAAAARFAYPDDVDRNISGFILALRHARRDLEP